MRGMKFLRTLLTSVVLIVPAVYVITLEIFPSSAGPRVIIFKVTGKPNSTLNPGPNAVRLGSLDLIEEVSEGLRLVGWVSRRTQAVIVVTKAGPHLRVFNALSQERPDVSEALRDPLQLFTGFDIVIPELRTLDITCVVASDGKSDVVLREFSSDC
jgi:hypothetical protein